MNRQILVRPRARRDLIEQFVFIGDKNEEAAFHFLAMVETTFEELSSMPEMGRLQDFANPKLKDMRQWCVRGFERHLIFYRPLPDGIEIIRVLDASRDVESLFS